MKHIIRQILSYTIILALATLPVRAAFSMPIATESGDNSHCDHAMMMQNDDMSMKMDMTSSEKKESKKRMSCCTQSGDCQNCLGSFIKTEMTISNIISITLQEEQKQITASVSTRSPTPPFRPPTTLA